VDPGDQTALEALVVAGPEPIPSGREAIVPGPVSKPPQP
jgi:hypothetical protein